MKEPGSVQVSESGVFGVTVLRPARPANPRFSFRVSLVFRLPPSAFHQSHQMLLVINQTHIPFQMTNEDKALQATQLTTLCLLLSCSLQSYLLVPFRVGRKLSMSAPCPTKKQAIVSATFSPATNGSPMLARRTIPRYSRVWLCVLSFLSMRFLPLSVPQTDRSFVSFCFPK